MELYFDGNIEDREVFDRTAQFGFVEAHGIFFRCENDLVACKKVLEGFADLLKVLQVVLVMIHKIHHIKLMALVSQMFLKGI